MFFFGIVVYFLCNRTNRARLSKHVVSYVICYVNINDTLSYTTVMLTIKKRVASASNAS